MGTTAPALHRYFGSHEDLSGHVAAGIFTETAHDITGAIAHAAAGAETSPASTAHARRPSATSRVQADGCSGSRFLPCVGDLATGTLPPLLSPSNSA
jgi:hypothetical protein